MLRNLRKSKLLPLSSTRDAGGKTRDGHLQQESQMQPERTQERIAVSGKDCRISRTTVQLCLEERRHEFGRRIETNTCDIFHREKRSNSSGLAEITLTLTFLSRQTRTRSENPSTTGFTSGTSTRSIPSHRWPLRSGLGCNKARSFACDPYEGMRFERSHAEEGKS